MRKKILPIILSGALLISCSSFAGCGEKSGDNSAIVWSALSTDKYMRTETPQTYSEAKLDFVGMKGETTALQVMITAKKYIKSFNLEFKDLSSKSGGVFSKENFKAYAERYVEVYDPYINDAYRGKAYLSDAGYYPDALVPLDRYIKNSEDRIADGDNQGIWVDCIIPSNAMAGEYSGTFTLNYGDETKEIPVSLKVYNVTMPEEVHSSSYFGIYYEQLSYGEGDNYTTETARAYYDFLLSKRLCADNLPPQYEKDLPTLFEFFASVAENPKVTSYCIPYRLLGYNKEILSPRPEEASKYSAQQRAAEADKLQANLKNIIETLLEKNLVLRSEGNEDIDLFKKLILSVEDEPGADWRFNRIRIFGERLTAAKRAVLQEKQAVWEAHPDLEQSLRSLEQICASNYVSSELWVSSKNGEGEEYVPDYEKGDGLKVWCPEQHSFRKADFRETVKERQALGEKFLWYTCCVNSPVMSYYVESIPVSTRAYSWMQYQYGIQGVLYWDTVHWTTVVGGDPYKSVFHTNGWGSDEGILLYPGVKYGLKTPVSSIRLEQIFHGQQDYEYFYMLDAYLTEYEIQAEAADLIEKLLVGIFEDGAYTVETAQGIDLETGRIQILSLLQDFATGNVNSAQTTINKILNK